MKILLIEDNDRDIQAFMGSAKAWTLNRPATSELVDVEQAKTIEQARDRLGHPEDLDGVVLDLKLVQDTDGEELLKHIHKLYLRIPVVVLSGTPWELDDALRAVCLRSFVKAEQHEKEILALLWDCKRTGLMNLIGGKGLFERYLKTVFDKCIVPRFDEWRGLLQVADGENAEVKASAALTRHILTCLSFMLSNDTDEIQPEECYIPLTSDAEAYKSLE